MDRNIYVYRFSKGELSVATREGGVDRNIKFLRHHLAYLVATREGGVDRNNQQYQQPMTQPMSPPARVAWIETIPKLT